MLLHWIWLSTLQDVHDRDKLTLLRHFHDPEDIFYAEPEAFSVVEELTEDIIQALQNKNLKQAYAILDVCEKKDIHICTYHDGAYPGKLKNIADPPLVLYYKGHLPDWDNRPVVAVVGTRNATPYGLNAARHIGTQLAQCGGIVVSGMAAGIDGSAISGALRSDGTVVGVLGCGVDVVYPASHKRLFADTERFGCLISEFSPGTPPLKWNFPKRNRIISGLSNGVLVVEAPAKSGALITARQAAEQGRDVFVVPGNIDVSTCAGSNALLREGAIAVSSGWDILSEYTNLYPTKIHGNTDLVQGEERLPVSEEYPALNVAQESETPRKNKKSERKNRKNSVDNSANTPYIDLQALSSQERHIVELIGEGALVDDVIAGSQLHSGVVLSTLTMLEIKGIVTRLPGKRVALQKRME